MYCTNCGHANPDNSRFCEQCGTPLQAGQQIPPSRPQTPPSRPQYPPSGPQYPPNRPGMGYQPPSAASTTPIWVLVSVIAGAAVILGFFLPWLSVGVYDYKVKLSGLTFIFNVVRIMFFGEISTAEVVQIIQFVLSFLETGQIVLVVLISLLIIASLVLTVVMAVKIILAGVKLLGNHAVLPGESSHAAEKIKRYSTIGLIAVGVYFLLAIVLLVSVKTYGLFSLNTLAFGFWLCLLGFGAALLGVTVVKEKF
mgnify:CR=1 FL=1